LNKREAPTKKKMAPGTVKIYNKVQLLHGLSFQTSAPSYTLKLQLNTYLRNVKWDRSKRLLNGSLLLLTKDECETVYFATVCRRIPSDLQRDGTFCIVWEGTKPEFQKEESFFDILECDIFFEPYRYYVLHTYKYREAILLWIVQSSITGSNPGIPVFLFEIQSRF
jgi:hypothetical protein